MRKIDHTRPIPARLRRYLAHPARLCAPKHIAAAGVIDAARMTDADTPTERNAIDHVCHVLSKRWAPDENSFKQMITDTRRLPRWATFTMPEAAKAAVLNYLRARADRRRDYYSTRIPDTDATTRTLDNVRDDALASLRCTLETRVKSLATDAPLTFSPDQVAVTVDLPTHSPFPEVEWMASVRLQDRAALVARAVAHPSFASLPPRARSLAGKDGRIVLGAARLRARPGEEAAWIVWTSPPVTEWLDGTKVQTLRLGLVTNAENKRVWNKHTINDGT